MNDVDMKKAGIGRGDKTVVGSLQSGLLPETYWFTACRIVEDGQEKERLIQ